MIRSSSAAWVTALVACAVAILAWSAVAAAPRESPAPAAARAHTLLVGASSGEHLWIVAPPKIVPPAGAPGIWRVLHHHPALPAGIRLSHDLEVQPEAMAAWDDRLWIVFPPSAPGGPREVWTVRAVRNPALETYFTEPAGRMSLLPGLPRAEALEGFTANADGPLAMVRDGGVRRLLRPAREGWTDASELPQSLREVAPTIREASSGASTTRTALVGAGSDGRTLVFAVQSNGTLATWRRPPASAAAAPSPSPDSRGREVAPDASGSQGSPVSPDATDSPASPEQGEAWRRSEHVPTRPGAILVGLGRDGDLPLAVFADASRVLLEYLRPQASVALAEFALPTVAPDSDPDSEPDSTPGSAPGSAADSPPSIAWTVLSLRDGPRLVEYDAERGPRIRRIDPQRGLLEEDLVIGALADSRARWMHLPVLGMIAGAALLGLLLFRADAIATAVAAPSGMVHAELGPRAIAAIIDYAPAALAVWIVMRGDPLDLVLLPIWSAPLERAIAPIAAILISVLCAAISEGLFGASFGKRLLGLRVVRVDGRRPSLLLALARGLLRFAVLTMPLLGVIHLLNPSHRGLPELLTGTAVVTRPPSDAAP